ncbi:MAG TPA: hypothetical protein VFA68_02970 [Terriglobales bacterium]|nr:hypothetical protein [Terriglobales bacterium]
MGRILTLAVLALSVSNGQTAPPISESVTLARMERSQPGEDVCVLVSQTGNYRLEQQVRTETRVFVGQLAASELQSLQLLLNDKNLRAITPDQVKYKPTPFTFDFVTFDIFREHESQHLVFKSPDSRKPFHDSVEPLLKWMSAIQKAPHQRVAESNASRCRPGTDNPADSDAARAATYLLVFKTSHAGNSQLKRTCEVIYSDGRYHREEGSQKAGQPLTARVSESSVTPEKLAELRELLDSADLKNSTHEAPSDEWAAEIEIIKASIPRGYFVQNLVFANYFGAPQNPGHVGGLKNDLRGVDKEIKVIKPLQMWLKANVEATASTPVDTAANDCRP